MRMDDLKNHTSKHHNENPPMSVEDRQRLLRDFFPQSSSGISGNQCYSCSRVADHGPDDSENSPSTLENVLFQVQTEERVASMDQEMDVHVASLEHKIDARIDALERVMI